MSADRNTALYVAAFFGAVISGALIGTNMPLAPGLMTVAAILISNTACVALRNGNGDTLTADQIREEIANASAASLDAAVRISRNGGAK